MPADQRTVSIPVLLAELAEDGILSGPVLLEDMSLATPDLARMCRALSRAPAVQDFELNYVRIDKNAWQPVVDFLRARTDMRRVEIWSCYEPDEIASAIMEALASCSQLESFDTEAQERTLYPRIVQNNARTLRSVDLVLPNGSEEPVDPELFRTLGQMPELRDLYLYVCEGGPDLLRSLEAVAPQLEKLELRFRNDSVAALEPVAKIVAKCTSLKSLQWSLTEAQLEGVASHSGFTAAFRKVLLLPSLQKLVVSGPLLLGPTKATAITTMSVPSAPESRRSAAAHMAQSARLEELVVDECDFDLAALRIKRVEIRSCPDGHDPAQTLADISRIATLEDIEYSVHEPSTPIPRLACAGRLRRFVASDSLCNLASLQHLGECRALQEVEIAMSSDDREVLAALGRTVRQWRDLETLSLLIRGPSLPDDAARALAELGQAVASLGKFGSLRLDSVRLAAPVGAGILEPMIDELGRCSQLRSFHLLMPAVPSVWLSVAALIGRTQLDDMQIYQAPSSKELWSVLADQISRVPRRVHIGHVAVEDMEELADIVSHRRFLEEVATRGVSGQGPALTWALVGPCRALAEVCVRRMPVHESAVPAMRAVCEGLAGEGCGPAQALVQRLRIRELAMVGVAARAPRRLARAVVEFL